MFALFNKTSFGCSKLITEHYSTSFTLGIKTLDKKLHEDIYGIYGFVRYADEIVDTFYDFDQVELLKKFKEDTYEAIEKGISLNPVLQSYQTVVNKHKIDLDLTEAFFKSMEMDLYEKNYECQNYEEYIYGSAEVIGLMCLKVFVEGDQTQYDSLKDTARSLGAAFQKVNFLRDMQSDFNDRGRVYFPGVDFSQFTEGCKTKIEEEIDKDFRTAYEGIIRLPESARMGVYLAYRYYQQLHKKIKKSSPSTLKTTRIRVPNNYKFYILCKAYLRNKVNAI